MTPCSHLMVSDVNYWVHLNAASAFSVTLEISVDLISEFQVLLPIVSVEPVFLATEWQKNEDLVQVFWCREGIEDALQQFFKNGTDVQKVKLKSRLCKMWRFVITLWRCVRSSLCSWSRCRLEGISNRRLTSLPKFPHWQHLHISSSPRTSLQHLPLSAAWDPVHCCTKKKGEKIRTLCHFILKSTRDFKAPEPNKTGCVSIYRWMRRDHQVVNSRCPLQYGLHPLLHISACHMLALRAHYQKKEKKKNVHVVIIKAKDHLLHSMKMC